MPVGQCGGVLHCLLEQLDYIVMDTIANCQILLFICLSVSLFLKLLFIQIPFQISVPRSNRGSGGKCCKERLWLDCAWYMELMGSRMT